MVVSLDCGSSGKEKLLREGILCQYLEGMCCDLGTMKGRDSVRYFRLLHA